MGVNKRMRYEVLRRDNFACRYCGLKASDTELVVDHVMPVALGGSDEPSNLVAACRDCNAGKAASNPDATMIDDVASDALRWAAAIKVAAEKRKLSREAEQKIFMTFVEYMFTMERNWPKAVAPSIDSAGSPTLARDTIIQFLKLGLSMEELQEAIEVAMFNDRIDEESIWKYFCGVCWRKVDALHDEASDLVKAGEV